MGTETALQNEDLFFFELHNVKLNNPLLGTETDGAYDTLYEPLLYS